MNSAGPRVTGTVENRVARRRSRRRFACALTVAALSVAAQALAVDGVIEINQARADKGGITPGDAPGLPITISTGTFSTEPMTFRLTGPLVNSTTSDVIQILSPHVTVDLNGFMITCALGSCSGNGILSGEDDVTVINGSVRGFSEGIDLAGSGCRVENLRALGNGVGVRLGNDGSVRDCSTNGNSNDGIRVGAGCTVSGNTASANGGDGICTHERCTLIGNTATGNGGYGFDLSTDAGYSRNVISGNTTGTVLNGVSAGLNVCNGVATCP